MKKQPQQIQILRQYLADLSEIQAKLDSLKIDIALIEKELGNV